MKVLIFEMKTGRLATSIPTVVAGINYTPDEREFFELAWKCAVDDKSVDADRKADYRFELHDEDAG